MFNTSNLRCETGRFRRRRQFQRQPRLPRIYDAAATLSHSVSLGSEPCNHQFYCANPVVCSQIYAQHLDADRSKHTHTKSLGMVLDVALMVLVRRRGPVMQRVLLHDVSCARNDATTLYCGNKTNMLRTRRSPGPYI